MWPLYIGEDVVIVFPVRDMRLEDSRNVLWGQLQVLEDKRD